MAGYKGLQNRNTFPKRVPTIQNFQNAGFSVDSDNFEYLVKVEGPLRKKDTSSVTNDAYDREFTLTSTMIVSIYNKSGEAIFERKIFSKSRDYSFSSSNIYSLKFKK